MQSPPAPPTSNPPAPPVAPAAPEPAPSVLAADEPHPDAALAELFRETAAAPFTAADAGDARRRGGDSRHAVWSLMLGLASLPLALLALIPTVWARLPAPIVGFLAIITGLIALQEIRQTGGRQRARKFALSGIVAGIIGSFLPPIVLAGLGRWLVQNSRTGATLAHLETIGTALGAYEREHGAYPPGGVFRPTRSGDQRGYHGWLTLLLPWLDQADLYAAIRQDVPYDEPANLPVFEQDIPEFFAAGTDRSKVRGKFGATHFAGVGGEITDETGDERRVLQAGLFGNNSSVKREQITDGLSHTLAAGEVADDIPPWGDPENWRQVGRGLNRDRQGFGNHARTGACFLMADGSVRFLSNRTAPEVLHALSTRDGGENRP